MTRWVLAGVTAAVLAATFVSASSASRPRYAYWRLTITGSQTMQWDYTQHFNTVDDFEGPCDVHHAGDQTIRWQTPGRIRVRLSRELGTGVESRIGGKWLNLVRLVGSEERVHRVIAAPADLSGCDPAARVAARNCSGTEPLVSGAVARVIVYPVRGGLMGGMWPPENFAFQPKFPQCNVPEFKIDTFFTHSIFSYGAFRKLSGGAVKSPRTRRLSGSFNFTVCLSTQFFGQVPSVTRCTNPHAATIVVNWQMTLTR